MYFKKFSIGALEKREMYWGKVNCLDYMKWIELNKYRIRVIVWLAYYDGKFQFLLLMTYFVDI